MIFKQKHKFPLTFILILIACILLYELSYYFPFTNNAFVVANTRPVAANVNGYITQLYVKNEEYVKKGAPLFTVFKKPYALAYKKAANDVAAAQAHLIFLQKQVQKTQFLLQSQQDTYEKLQYEYTHNKSALADHAVSKVMVNTLLKEHNAALNTFKAIEIQLELNRQEIMVQEKKIDALIAVMENAKVDLDETTVYAKNNGVVQNMFTALGAPIEIRKPIFSFVDADNMFIQANFNETDLRYVRPGNNVTIRPRIYFGTKIYHGIVVSKNWAASRQITDLRSQQQIVTNNEDNWLLLPQRFPVQIRIVDYDPIHYPLSIGASAYVYIHTDKGDANGQADGRTTTG